MFNINLSKGISWSRSGVYKINFGPRFYIGCAQQVGGMGARIRSHKSVINALLKEEPTPNLPGSYLNIIYWLYAHPEIHSADVELLEYYIVSEDPIAEVEYRWITQLSVNGLCLNKWQEQAPDHSVYQNFPIVGVDETTRDANLKRLYKSLFKK